MCPYVIAGTEAYLESTPKNNVIVKPLSALGWPCRLPSQPKVYADQFHSDVKGLLDMVLTIKESWKGVGSFAVSIVFEAVNMSFAAG